jgi:hypothetical protein
MGLGEILKTETSIIVFCEKCMSEIENYDWDYMNDKVELISHITKDIEDHKKDCMDVN